MPYAFYAVLNALPQIAAAAALPIIAIALVSYLIKSPRSEHPRGPIAAE